MDNKWDRVNEIFFINNDIVNKLIKRFDSRLSVERFEILLGGKSTTNYKLKIKENQYLVLRIYPKNDKTYKKEYTISRVLGYYVRMPKVYYFNNDLEIINRPFSIIEFLDGMTLDQYILNNDKIPDSLAYEIGENLSMLHQNKYNKEGSIDEYLNITDEIPPLFEWYSFFLNSHAGKVLGDKQKNDILNYLEKNNSLILEMTKDNVLCHGDFRPENIMVNNNKLVGIIDWEFSLSAPIYFDIGQFIRCEEYMKDNLKEYFIKGYKENSKICLFENWEKYAKLIDLANLLCLINNKAISENMILNIKKLIENSLKY